MSNVFVEYLREAQSEEVIKYNKIKKLKAKIQNNKIVRFLNDNLSLNYHPKDFSIPYKDTTYSIKKLSDGEIDIIHYKNTVEITSGYIQLYNQDEPYSLIFSSHKKSTDLSFVRAEDVKSIKSLSNDLKLLGDIFKVLEFSKLDIYDNFVNSSLKEMKDKNLKSKKAEKAEKINFDECVDILYKNIQNSKNKEAYLINHSDVRDFLNEYDGYVSVKNISEFKSKIKDLDHIIYLIRNEK